MNVKMNTGSKIAVRPDSNVNMLFLPLVMQQGDISNLRTTIKSMTSVSGRQGYRGKSERSEYTTTWSPAKQMEHELTRNRMKRIMRTRKKRQILSESSSNTESTTSPSDSPAESSSSSNSSETLMPKPNADAITEKQLQVFFEPPESVEEMMITRSSMVMPPANMDELMKIKAKRKESEKKICKFCYRKLPLAEQHIQCLCRQSFCKKHRQPSAHYCSVDYKQKGRSKISKENPKISEGGYHKAKHE